MQVVTGFDKETGAWVFHQEGAFDQSIYGNELAFAEGDLRNTHFYDNITANAVVPLLDMKLMPLIDGVRNVPDGAKIVVTGPLGGTVIHDTGDFTLTSEDSGTYTLTVTLFPYMQSEVEVVIT